MAVGGSILFFGNSLETLEQSSQFPDASAVLTSDPYHSKIQPIFNSRCVACHSCYNSPCQLDLTSYEGLSRGASKTGVYDFPLAFGRRPTRLGIDGKSVAEWRSKGFFSVLSEEPTTTPENSTLLSLISMRKRGFESAVEKWNSESSRFCPNSQAGASTAIESEDSDFSELEYYRQHFPNRGMPYGFPPLKDSEVAILVQWIQAGAQGPGPAAKAFLSRPDPETQSLIGMFEVFFNAKDFKSRLSARYIYEHLFLAHLYFEERPGSFYRLVRAKNAVGEPDEIATVRPFDDPGPRFFYRFKKHTGTLTHKNHIPYALSRRKLAIWKSRFLMSRWVRDEETWPAYGQAGANPFTTFIAIPAQTRARFLLEDAYYHTMTFIKGPVCNGSVAVSVIDDHFWVLFADPDRDIAVIRPEFFEDNAQWMSLPANFSPADIRMDDIRHNNTRVNKSKFDLYRIYQSEGGDLSNVWDGDGIRSDALLTIYRHDDSATVIRGAHGQVPKTIWLLDYPTFEDIYYNLVAGYDVYGPITHQITTRLHMDHSRVDAQDLFISLLPEARRMTVRGEWTKKAPREGKKINALIAKLQQKDLHKRMQAEKPYAGIGWRTHLSYQSADEKVELLSRIFSERLKPGVRGKKDGINCCGGNPAANQKPITGFADVENWLAQVSGKPAPFAVALPDASYVRVTLPSGEAKAYTLIHNKEHYNVSFMFFEDLRRNPSQDSIHFVPGYAASYPNMYFDVRSADVPEFIRALQSLNSKPESWKALTLRFGVLRSSDRFWPFHDWLIQNFKKLDPIEGSHLDLNRYSGDQ